MSHLYGLIHLVNLHNLLCQQIVTTRRNTNSYCNPYLDCRPVHDRKRTILFQFTWDVYAESSDRVVRMVRMRMVGELKEGNCHTLKPAIHACTHNRYKRRIHTQEKTPGGWHSPSVFTDRISYDIIDKCIWEKEWYNSIIIAWRWWSCCFYSWLVGSSG